MVWSSRLSSPSTPQVTWSIPKPDGSSPGSEVRTANRPLTHGNCLRSAAPIRTPAPQPGQNTTIGIVATNARLDKAQANRMALMADDGLARAIVPSHTLGDGDTVFALATGRYTGTVNVTVIGALAADAMAEAIVRAAALATSAGGLPAARDLGSVPERLRGTTRK